jgi:hypothetical protein
MNSSRLHFDLNLRLLWWASIAILAVALASGCTTKRIISQWSNPAYRFSRPPFERILVVATTDQTSIRRNFEDELAAELKERGLNAVPSYRFFAEDGTADVSRLKEIAHRAGADAAIVTRLVRVEEHTDVTPGYYDPYPFSALYGWYSPRLHARLYSPPRIYRYPVYFSETTLYDIAKDELVWAGTIRTIDPENADEAIKDYTQTVVSALKERSLLPG